MDESEPFEIVVERDIGRGHFPVLTARIDTYATGFQLMGFLPLYRRRGCRFRIIDLATFRTVAEGDAAGPATLPP